MSLTLSKIPNRRSTMLQSPSSSWRAFPSPTMNRTDRKADDRKRRLHDLARSRARVAERNRAEQVDLEALSSLHSSPSHRSTHAGRELLSPWQPRQQKNKRLQARRTEREKEDRPALRTRRVIRDYLPSLSNPGVQNDGPRSKLSTKEIQKVLDMLADSDSDKKARPPKRHRRCPQPSSEGEAEDNEEPVQPPLKHKPVVIYHGLDPRNVKIQIGSQEKRLGANSSQGRSSNKRSKDPEPPTHAGSRLSTSSALRSDSFRSSPPTTYLASKAVNPRIDKPHDVRSYWEAYESPRPVPYSTSKKRGIDEAYDSNSHSRKRHMSSEVPSSTAEVGNKTEKARHKEHSQSRLLQQDRSPRTGATSMAPKKGRESTRHSITHRETSRHPRSPIAPADEDSDRHRDNFCFSSDLNGRTTVSHPRLAQPVPRRGGPYDSQRTVSDNTASAVAHVGGGRPSYPASQKELEEEWRDWLQQPTSADGSHRVFEGDDARAGYHISPGVSQRSRLERESSQPLPSLDTSYDDGTTFTGAIEEGQLKQPSSGDTDTSAILTRYEALMNKIHQRGAREEFGNEVFSSYHCGNSAWTDDNGDMNVDGLLEPHSSDYAPGDIDDYRAYDGDRLSITAEIQHDEASCGAHFHDGHQNQQYPSTDRATYDQTEVSVATADPTAPATFYTHHMNTPPANDSVDPWLAFVFGEDDSDEVEFSVFSQASRDATKTIQPSEVSMSTAEPVPLEKVFSREAVAGISYFKQTPLSQESTTRPSNIAPSYQESRAELSPSTSELVNLPLSTPFSSHEYFSNGLSFTGSVEGLVFESNPERSDAPTGPPSRQVDMGSINMVSNLESISSGSLSTCLLSNDSTGSLDSFFTAAISDQQTHDPIRSSSIDTPGRGGTRNEDDTSPSSDGRLVISEPSSTNAVCNSLSSKDLVSDPVIDSTPGHCGIDNSIDGSYVTSDPYINDSSTVYTPGTSCLEPIDIPYSSSSNDSQSKHITTENTSPSSVLAENNRFESRTETAVPVLSVPTAHRPSTQFKQTHAHTGEESAEQFRFAIPKLFVGSHATPNQTTTPRVPLNLKKRGRQRKRAADGRADIRAVPNYASDPIEDFEEPLQFSKPSLFPALECS
ncbi:hypothetical protein QBC35DRAFT_165074 [Podospora australis]|uniref:Uncharacterized protein n=1 Tax=Podospora australis TaxID=1536484 RepID=A0AAN6X341_9PEZI|nr:hypothetical protein QBC35DRAFT_165074 [Podospora australis]